MGSYCAASSPRPGKTENIDYSETGCYNRFIVNDRKLNGIGSCGKSKLTGSFGNYIRDTGRAAAMTKQELQNTRLREMLLRRLEEKYRSA